MRIGKENLETKVIPIKKEEQSEFEEFRKRIEQDMKDHEKRIKKQKIFFMVLMIYIATILLAGLTGFFIPQAKLFTDIYLIVCNLIAVCLCIWSTKTFFKSSLHKEKGLRWLLVANFGGIIMNIFFAGWNIIELVK